MWELNEGIYTRDQVVCLTLPEDSSNAMRCTRRQLSMSCFCHLFILNQCYRAPGTRAGRPWLYGTVEEKPLSLRNSQSDSPYVSVVQTQLVYNLHSFICKNGMMVTFDSNPPAHRLSASGHSTSAFSLLLTSSLPSYPSDGSRRDTRGVKSEDFILWHQGSATVLPQSNRLLEALSHPLEPGVSFPSSLGEMHRRFECLSFSAN